MMDWNAITTDEKTTGKRIVRSGLTNGLTEDEAGALVELGVDLIDIARMKTEVARKIIFEAASEGLLDPFDWFDEDTAWAIEEKLGA